MELHACNVWRLSEFGVADNIEICESSEPESIAEAAASGGLHIEQGFSATAKLVSQVEGFHVGGRMLAIGVQTIGTAVCRMEIRMGLKHDIGLAADPPARGLGVREEGDDVVVSYVGRHGFRILRDAR